jgi:hypothetical protein
MRRGGFNLRANAETPGLCTANGVVFDLSATWRGNTSGLAIGSGGVEVNLVVRVGGETLLRA